MYSLLLLVTALIVYGSLYPWTFDFDRAGGNPVWVLTHAWPAHINRFVLRDVAVNVLLYLPFGWTAFLALARGNTRGNADGIPRRYGRWLAAAAALLLGLGLTCSIEMLQIFIPARNCNLLDVVSNFAGTLAGVLAAAIFQPEQAQPARDRNPRAGSGSAILLTCCWAGYQLYPLFPALSRTHLRANFARLTDAPVDWADAGASAAEWCVFALLLHALIGRLRAPVLFLLMACLPLRLLLVQRTLTPAELLGAALALLWWSVLDQRMRLSLGVWLLAAAVLLRELEPFRFAAPAADFSWVPFRASFEAGRQLSALTLFRKAFEYGGLLWLLRERGVPYLAGGVAVAAGLGALEAFERYLPGRTPEITDAVLALLLALALWLLSGPPRSPD